MKLNKKILIIDDEEADRKSISLALVKEGFEDVSSASNADEGLQAAQTLKPDIIVIDVVLPNGKGLDGFDLCKQIKSIKGLDATRIIMITGHLDAVNAEKARSSGADEIIEKIPGFKNISKTITSLSHS